MHLDWYFDFISPYAYLQFRRLPELPEEVSLTLKPVLFAGLLNHWGQLGPAEIAPKRLYTYRHVGWIARHHGIAFNMPAAHPFNPLPALRLACFLDADTEIVARIFGFIWAEGGNIGDVPQFQRLGRELGVPDAMAAVADPVVKRQLRSNTDEAIENGVFGVPSFVREGILLWGQDSLDIIRDWLQDPELFSAEESTRLAELPEAAVRRRGS